MLRHGARLFCGSGGRSLLSRHQVLTSRHVCSCIDDEDRVWGFSRPREGEPAGSVKLLHQMLFVHTGHNEWPLAWAQGEPPSIQQFVEQANQEKKNLNSSMGVVGCNLPGKNESHVTVTSYPHAKQYHLPMDDLEHQTHALFTHFHDHQVPWEGLSDDLAHKHQIFICCHGATDRRCGYCGPRLVEAFESYLQTHALSHRVQIVQTTHIGGHKYAGNAVVFPSGDWFGYVTPERVGEIITASIEQYESHGEGLIIPDLWRGRLGLSKQEALALVEAADSSRSTS